MTIVHGTPPNWEEINAKWKVNQDRVIVTYAPNIYTPGGHPIESDLLAHERTHLKQQEAIGVKEWWDRYMTDDQFRTDQELEAYRVQYQFRARIEKDRNRLSKFLSTLAHDMSSAMYGNMVTYPQAMKLIRG